MHVILEQEHKDENGETVPALAMVLSIEEASKRLDEVIYDFDGSIINDPENGIIIDFSKELEEQTHTISLSDTKAVESLKQMIEVQNEMFKSLGIEVE